MDSRQELCLQITARSELTGPGKETGWPWLAWAPSQGPYSAGAELGLPPQAAAAQPMLGWQTSFAASPESWKQTGWARTE